MTEAVANGNEGSELEPKKPAGIEVPAFPFQLVDVYLRSCSLTRREATEEDPEQPTFNTGLVVQDGEAFPGFHAHLTVDVTFRFRQDAICLFSACTTGVFRQVGELDETKAAQFRKQDCAVLLWSYARANIGEIARMSGVQLPPLPTIDVRQTLSNLHSEG